MTDPTDLKPCRFCGSDDTATRYSIGDHTAYCHQCGATGPWKATEAEAIAAWNRRADDAALTAAERRGMERAAEIATSFLVGDPAKGVPLRNPMAHEIAAAIRDLARQGGDHA